MIETIKDIPEDSVLNQIDLKGIIENLGTIKIEESPRLTKK